MKRTLLASVTLVALATPSYAQSNAATLSLGCSIPGNICFTDTHNQIVGKLTSDSFLARPINGTWYTLDFTSAGVNQTVQFYYPEPGCPADKRFLWTGVMDPTGTPDLYMLQDAAYYGTTMFIPTGKAFPMPAASAGPGPGPLCGSYGSNPKDWPTIVVQAATPAENITFYPPLTPMKAK